MKRMITNSMRIENISKLIRILKKCDIWKIVFATTRFIELQKKKKDLLSILCVRENSSISKRNFPEGCMELRKNIYI